MTFAIYVALGNKLDLGRVFATLQFFNFIQQPLTWFPRIFATLSTILVASRECCLPSVMTSADVQVVYKTL